MLAVAVLVVASLTPSSCSDVAEQAMAFEDDEAVVMDQIAIERSMQQADLGVDVKLDDVNGDAASDADADETGS